VSVKNRTWKVKFLNFIFVTDREVNPYPMSRECGRLQVEGRHHTFLSDFCLYWLSLLQFVHNKSSDWVTNISVFFTFCQSDKCQDTECSKKRVAQEVWLHKFLFFLMNFRIIWDVITCLLNSLSQHIYSSHNTTTVVLFFLSKNPIPYLTYL
jgi:hypothetical protein